MDPRGHDKKRPSFDHQPAITKTGLHERVIPYELKVEEASTQLNQKKLNLIQFLEDLNKIKALYEETNAARIWANEIAKYLQNIWNDILAKNNIPADQSVPHALCISGSLAKKQATQYSDLDCFIITQDATVTDILKPAIKDLNDVFYYIFEKTNQLSFDAIGINAAKFFGTPQELVNKITSGAVADQNSFYDSMLSSKPIFGKPLFDEFQSLLKKEDNKLAIRAYKQALSFSGPQDKNKINLKRDIFRPLDFIMMGLRFEFGIQYEVDGSHLETKKLAEILLRRGKIAPEIHLLVTEIFDQAMNLRSDKHNSAKEEDDIIRLNEVDETTSIHLRKLIDGIAILRGITKRRLNLLGENDNLNQLPIFGIENLLNPEYQDASYDVKDMKLDLKPIADTAANYYYEKQDEDKGLKYAGAAKLLDIKNQMADRIKQIEKQLVNLQKPPAAEEEAPNVAPSNAHKVSLLHVINNIETLIESIKKMEIPSENLLDYSDVIHYLNAFIANPNLDTLKDYTDCLQSKSKKITPDFYQKANNIGIKISTLISTSYFLYDLNSVPQCFNALLTTHFYNTFRKNNGDLAVKIIDRIAKEETNKIDNKQANVNVLLKNNINPSTMTVIKAIDIISTYPANSIFHFKRDTVNDIINETYIKLAQSGPQDAALYLHQRYVKELKSSPNSTLSKLLSQALMTTVGLKSPKNANIYNNHTQIMRNIYPHTHLAEQMHEYVTSRTYRFLRIPFIKSTIGINDITHDEMIKAKNQVEQGVDVTNFNFPRRFLRQLKEKPIANAEMRASLLNNINDELLKGSDIAKSTNKEIAFGEIHRLMVNVLNSSDNRISNAKLTKFHQALKLSNEIMHNDNPAAVTELQKLIPVMRESEALKPFVRHFKVIANDQHRKEKLISKLNKKINSSSFNFDYDDKREALETLRSDLKNAANNNKSVEQVINDWKVINDPIINKPRFALFFFSKQTKTKQFVDELATKYNNVQVKNA